MSFTKYVSAAITASIVQEELSHLRASLQTGKDCYDISDNDLNEEENDDADDTNDVDDDLASADHDRMAVSEIDSDEEETEEETTEEHSDDDEEDVSDTSTSSTSSSEYDLSDTSTADDVENSDEGLQLQGPNNDQGFDEIMSDEDDDSLGDDDSDFDEPPSSYMLFHQYRQTLQSSSLSEEDLSIMVTSEDVEMSDEDFPIMTIGEDVEMSDEEIQGPICRREAFSRKELEQEVPIPELPPALDPAEDFDWSSMDVNCIEKLPKPKVARFLQLPQHGKKQLYERYCYRLE